MIFNNPQSIETSLMALWNKNGFPVLQLEVGDVPFPVGNVLCINFLPKPFGTWSVPDEIVRLSIIWLIEKGISKRFNGLQWSVNTIRPMYKVDDYNYVVIAKYWAESDRLRWMEKRNRWYPFSNPLRRVPLKAMITDRDFRGFAPDRLLAEMSTLQKWPCVRVLSPEEVKKMPLPLPK